MTKKTMTLFWILWLLLCFQINQTLQQSSPGTTKGKLFVFSYIPTSVKVTYSYRLIVSISSFSEGSTTTRVQCKRYCGKNMTDGTTLETYSVRFGKVETYKIPKSRSKKAVFEPFNQTVYTISSVKQIMVLLGEVLNSRDFDCAFVYPFTSADTKYVLITSNTQSSFIQIVTFDSKTIIKIKVLDQFDIIERYSSFTDLKPKDHNSCDRSKGGCNMQSYDVSVWSSLTSVESITFNEILTYNLDSFQALSLFRFKKKSCCDFSGSQITSDKPIVVKVGSDSSNYGLAPNADNTFEFLPGERNLGRNFIIPRNTQIELKYNVKVLTAADSNKFSLEVIEQNAIERAHLQKRGDWFSALLNGKINIAIKATKASIIGFLAYEYSGAGPCFTIILPILLWADTYHWADIELKSSVTFTQYATILAREPEKNGIVLDEEENFPFTIFSSDLFKETKWASYTKITATDAQVGAHVAYQKNSQDSFMIKIYGYRHHVAYCTFAGAVFRAVNAKCFPTETIPGDNLDNDCDGKFDEELADGLDNDNDNNVDEDLKAKEKINGKWSEWVSNTECVVNCDETEGQINDQVRYCNNPKPENGGLPCEGESTSKSSSTCTGNLVLCSYQCKPFTYGYNCSKKCDKCELPCDAVTGHCTECKSGLALPFCNETCSDKNCERCSRDRSCYKCLRGFMNPLKCELCPDGVFGEDCLENCTANCSVCHGDTGICLVCKPGLKPPSCEERCLEPGCSNCTIDDTCLSCKPGYGNPPNCAKCPNGTFGEGCTGNCSLNCIACEGESGDCIDCEINFQLPNCDECSRGFSPTPLCQPCSNGFFGDDCSETCLPDPGCAICDGKTGECTECNEGYKQPHCNETVLITSGSKFLSTGIIGGIISVFVCNIIIAFMFLKASKNEEIIKVVSSLKQVEMM